MNDLTLGGTAGTILWQMDQSTVESIPLRAVTASLILWDGGTVDDTVEGTIQVLGSGTPHVVTPDVWKSDNGSWLVTVSDPVITYGSGAAITFTLRNSFGSLLDLSGSFASLTLHYEPVGSNTAFRIFINTTTSPATGVKGGVTYEDGVGLTPTPWQGVQVTLLIDGAYYATAVTDSSGDYSFTDTPTGVAYVSVSHSAPSNGHQQGSNTGTIITGNMLTLNIAATPSS